MALSENRAPLRRNLFFYEYVRHPIAPGRSAAPARCPACSAPRAKTERSRRSMAESQPLARPQKQHLMLAHHIPTRGATRTADARPCRPCEPLLGRRCAQGQGGARGRIVLVPMVDVLDLDVEARPAAPRRPGAPAPPARSRPGWCWRPEQRDRARGPRERRPASRRQPGGPQQQRHPAAAQAAPAGAAPPRPWRNRAPARRRPGARSQLRSSSAIAGRREPGQLAASRPSEALPGRASAPWSRSCGNSRQQAQQAPAHAPAGADDHQPDRRRHALGHGGALEEALHALQEALLPRRVAIAVVAQRLVERCSSSRCSADSLTGVSTTTRQNRSPCSPPRAGLTPLPRSRNTRPDCDLGRHLQAHFALERGHLDAAAQRRGGEGQRHLAAQVRAVALEDRVFAHLHLDVQIAGRAAVASGLALACQPHAIAGVDARRES